MNDPADDRRQSELPAELVPATPPARRRRLNGIDICRSGAIILAMSSHAMVEAKLWRYVDGWPPELFVGLRVLMQMAPVTFIVLFGAMLEIAYRPQFQRGDGRAATGRLLTRAGQCYLLYVVTIIAHAVADGLTIGYALRCILMAGVTPYADILKFYAVALFLAPAVIVMRERIGLPGLFVLAVAIRLAYPLIHALPEPPLVADKDYLGPITGFLIGRGGSVGAPSVLHGMSLVLTGMVVGYAVRSILLGDPADRRRGMGWAAAVASVSMVITLAAWNHDDPWQTARGLSDMTIRNLNHPLYYACGVLTTLAAVALCSLAFDRGGQRWLDGIKFIGAFSVFTFSFGNVLLYLQPFTAADAAGAHLLWLGLSAAVVLQTFLYARLIKGPRDDRESRPLALARRAVGAIVTRSDQLIAWVTRPIADRYAAALLR